MDGVVMHGTEGILVAVLEEQSPRLRGFFIRGAGATALAEDLVQETLLRAWNHRGSVAADPSTTEGDVRGGARRYLWRVARNLMIDEIRWRQRHRLGTDLVPAPAEHDLDINAAQSIDQPVAEGPDEAVEREECRRVIRETVGHLANVRVRRCLELWLGGCDSPGIAKQLGLGVGQVRGLLQRGRSEVVRRAGERLEACPAAYRTQTSG